MNTPCSLSQRALLTAATPRIANGISRTCARCGDGSELTPARYHGPLTEGRWAPRKVAVILFGSVPRLTIATIADDLIGELRYLNASPRGGTEVCRLPIHRARLAP